MEHKGWLHRVLTTILLLGTVVAAVLWVVTLTARCEGFGCIGKGMGMAFTLLLQLILACVGAILIWLKSRDGRAPAWLWVLEVVLALPVIGFLLSLAINS